jgi:hypothetical protein
MGFDLTDQLLIRSFAFVRYWRRNGSTMRQYISYSYTSRKPMILLEFGVPVKLLRLINLCFNETLTDARIDVDLEVNAEKLKYIVTRTSVTTDGVWTGDWIC